MSDLGEESSVHGQSRDGISGESALDLIDQSSLFFAEHILGRIDSFQIKMEWWHSRRFHRVLVAYGFKTERRLFYCHVHLLRAYFLDGDDPCTWFDFHRLYSI
ncbi:MAG: hypothetical protein ACPHK2_03655 [Candidatus Poseidoniaceae archaeon]